jgi:hypothetical protein
MITVAVLNIVVVFLAFFARFKNWEFLLKISFGLLFVFLALRYDYGNDYPGYLKDFMRLSFSDFTSYSKTTHFEPGWTFLCYLFRPFGVKGFFAMTAVLALFNCVVYYRFIKRYVPPAYYWLAVFLYVFTPELMLIHASAMRQSVAISLFLIAIGFLQKKNVIGYFICIGIATLFHLSALILRPVFLLGMFNWKINKATAAGLLASYIVFVFMGKVLKEPITNFIATYFQKYAVYNSQSGIEIGTGMGLMFYTLLFVLILWYEQYQTRENAIVFKLAVVSYLLLPVSLIIMILGRSAMYFQPATIAVIPMVFANIKNVIIRYTVMFALIAITLLSFNGFFHSKVWVKKFGTYQTIFSSQELYR